MHNYDEIKAKLKTMLKEKRYIHSLGTMQTSVELAKRYGANQDKAQLAGLLHDCAKNIAYEKAYTMCEEYGIPLDPIMCKSPKLIHQLLGAEVARREFGVEDEEVLQAIRVHTTGAPDMTMLDKIIYLADFTEPNRERLKGMDELRELTHKDLDDAMLFALDISIKIALKKGNLLHPDAVHARNQLVES